MIRSKFWQTKIQADQCIRTGGGRRDGQLRSFTLLDADDLDSYKMEIME